MADISNNQVIKLWKDIDLKLKHNVVDDEISGDLKTTKYKGIDPSKIAADLDLWDLDSKTQDRNVDGSWRQQHLIKYLVEDLEKEIKEKTDELNRLKYKSFYEAKDAYKEAYSEAEKAYTNLQRASTALVRERSKIQKTDVSVSSLDLFDPFGKVFRTLLST